MINDHWDDYLIPGTNVLKNKLNITNREELIETERKITKKTLTKAYLKPTCKDFNIEELKKLHKNIFGSIYPFAGEFRLCTLGKDYSAFCHPHDIESNLTEILENMNNLPDINSPQELAFYVAPFYHDLIMVHPFREGNGRTIRVFVREFILEKSKNLGCGPLDIDYTKMDSDNLLIGTVERYVYQSMLEIEFMKALISTQKENNHHIR